MQKILCVICVCWLIVPLFGQSSSGYQVATITEVKLHQPAAGANSTAVSYDVSLKVGNTIYVTLYTPPLGVKTVKDAPGRSLLVQVGKKTITYNDILGRSSEVPIISQRPAADAGQAK